MCVLVVYRAAYEQLWCGWHVNVHAGGGGGGGVWLQVSMLFCGVVMADGSCV